MRKQNFNFDMIDVPTGKTLAFRGREGITCIVANQVPPLVEYEGEVVSLTRATKLVTGKTPEIAASWTYEGELLSMRRKRIDACRVEREVANANSS